jgi:hypothetical protein
MIAEPIRVLLAVVERLDRLGIRYVVGGSVSSSVFGAVAPSLTNNGGTCSGC